MLNGRHGSINIGKLKIKVDFYDHKDKFQNNFQKIILDMFRCTTPSSEDKKLADIIELHYQPVFCLLMMVLYTETCQE